MTTARFSRLGVAAAGLAAVALLAPAHPAAALTDVPVAGKTLVLIAKESNPERRRLRFRALDPLVAPPFADPTQGASILVFASNAAGHCRAEIALPAANWSPIGDDGPNRGWKYRDKTGSAQGIHRG